MRRLSALVTAIILLCTLVFSVSASEAKLQMTDVRGSGGDIVQITVSLLEQTRGNAIGISYTFDETHLKVLPEQCGWSKKSVLQDFSSSDRNGVWAVSTPIDLKGDVCVLVFQIVDGTSFTETEVSCNLTVKNGNREVGNYQASASVSLQCSHNFGSWSDSGELGHSRMCSICNERQTQTHSWKEGTLTQDPNNSDNMIKTNTCTICFATRTESILGEKQMVIPTIPSNSWLQSTEPSPTEERPTPTYPEEQEETRPSASKTAEESKQETVTFTETPDWQEQVEPESYQPGDYNRPPEETKAEGDIIESTKSEGYANLYGQTAGETAPLVIPIEDWTGETEASQESTDDYDHVHEETSTASGFGAFAALVAVAVTIVATWLYQKKRR